MPARLNPEQLDEAVGLQRKGKTQQEIASTLGVERTAVSRCLARYNRRVMVRLEARAVAEKGRQLDRLDYLYAQACEGWRRSCEDAVSIKESDDGLGGAKVETTTKGQAGDPAMIGQARASLTDMRSILGLDAPAKLEQSGVQAIRIEYVNDWRGAPHDPAPQPPPRPAASPDVGPAV